MQLFTRLGLAAVVVSGLVTAAQAQISQFSISYDGEQWRNSGSTVPNVLTLQLSLDGTTWVSLGAAVNFTSPINTATAGLLDGNALANRVAGIGGTFTPSTPIPNGSVFYLRWADPDDTGADAGLAVDNSTFSAVPEPSIYVLLGVGILLCGQRFLRGRRS